MDRLTPEQRHRNMSNIKSKNTSIEITLRRALRENGFGYRLHYKDLPGKPDIVLTKYRIAIFCDSEFFHGYDFGSLEEQLKKGKNADFWIKKIKRNMERDLEIEKTLNGMGWTVLRFWGKQIMKDTDECIRTIKDTILDNKAGGITSDQVN